MPDCFPVSLTVWLCCFVVAASAASAAAAAAAAVYSWVNKFDRF